MSNKFIQIILSISVVIQILILGNLAIGEIQGLLNNLEYRFQYLLILYGIIPGLIIVGLLEYFGIKKLINGHSKIMLFPFLIAFSLLIVLSNEGSYDSIKLSYFVIITEILAILLLAYSLFKIVKVDYHKPKN